MLTPGERFPEVDLFNAQDKLIHLLTLGIQGYLWTGVGIKSQPVGSHRKRAWINFLVFGLLIGIVFESLQQIIPNRSFEWTDMIVNAIGGYLGFLAYFKWPSIKFILD